MLSICSDLDETPSAREYFSIAKYLNSCQDTVIGRGLNLEVGNTIYFDMPSDQFAYWNSTDRGREDVHILIRSGHIDCFHSFGDSADTREAVQRSLEALENNDCQLTIWIDHSKAVTNFGADIMRGRGDIENDTAYHADLSVNHGVSFVWLGRVTSMVGQDAKYRPSRIYNKQFPVSSGRALAKDAAKKVMAFCGSKKYSLHRRNSLLRPHVLRDGNHVLEFMRCNPHPGGVSCGDDSQGIADVLTRKNLDALVQCGGVSILYTHLGKKLQGKQLLTNRTIRAFNRLAEYVASGKILVATTARNLRYQSAYNDTLDSLLLDEKAGRLDITLKPESDPSGLSFYFDDAAPVVRMNGIEMSGLIENAADETGRRSISLPWQPLHYPL